MKVEKKFLVFISTFRHKIWWSAPYIQDCEISRSERNFTVLYYSCTSVVQLIGATAISVAATATNLNKENQKMEDFCIVLLRQTQ